MYVETNGYKYNVSEVTGEDTIYMERPRCVVELGDIKIDTAELPQPFIRGVYERLDNEDKKIKGYNAEIQRMPIEMTINLQYVLSTFNEGLVLTQEIIDRMCFQRYFSVVYLGQIIKCSIEFPQDFTINMNKIDMSSAEANNKTISFSLNLCTSYPAIDENTEVKNSYVMGTLVHNTGTFYGDNTEVRDEEDHAIS